MEINISDVDNDFRDDGYGTVTHYFLFGLSAHGYHCKMIEYKEGLMDEFERQIDILGMGVMPEHIILFRYGYKSPGFGFTDRWILL